MALIGLSNKTYFWHIYDLVKLKQSRFFPLSKFYILFLSKSFPIQLYSLSTEEQEKLVNLQEITTFKLNLLPMPVSHVIASKAADFFAWLHPRQG